MKTIGVSFEVVPMVFARYSFDLYKFYSQLIDYDRHLEADTFKPAENFESFKQSLCKRMFSNRVYLKNRMQLGRDTWIGIKIVYTIKSKAKPSASSISKDGEKPLKRLTIQRVGKVAKHMEKNNVGKCMEIGGDILAFTEKDLEKAVSHGPSGVSIIGFKDTKALKSHYNLMPSATITHDDGHYANSSSVFTALVREMIDLKKVAIARFRFDKRSQARFCALIPDAVSSGADAHSVCNRLHAVFLPYADDLRNITGLLPLNRIEPKEYEVKAAMELVNGLKIDQFDPKRFEDPQKTRFNDVLQALAMGEDTDITTRDVMQPDYPGMKKKKSVIDGFIGQLNGGLNTHRKVEERSPLLKKKQAPSKSKRSSSTNHPQARNSRNRSISQTNNSRSQHSTDKTGPNDYQGITNEFLNELSKSSSLTDEKFKNAIIPELGPYDHKVGRKQHLSKAEKNLLAKIKSYDYGNIKIHELDEFLDDHDILINSNLNKADKIRLVTKYISS